VFSGDEATEKINVSSVQSMSQVFNTAESSPQLRVDFIRLQNVYMECNITNIQGYSK